MLDDLQTVKYLKHFADTEKGETQPGDTGLIAEINLGPGNPETGEFEEVTGVHFHAAIKSRFFPEESHRDPEIHEVGYSLLENPDTKIWEFFDVKIFISTIISEKAGKAIFYLRRLLNLK